MAKSEFIEAGRINNTHGIAGELRVEVWLDSPEFMKKFKRLFIGGREYRLESAKLHKGGLIVRFEGITDVNSAMPFKGKTVYIAREDAHLPAGGYFLQEIIGASVVDEQGNEVGTLKEIVESPASNIYVVQGKQGHLIPAVPEFILHTDAEAGIITVRLIEGM